MCNTRMKEHVYEGEAMRDIEVKVLEKYWIDVNSIRKVRSGFLCDTKQGLLRLKELSSSEKKVPYVHFLCEQLVEAGFTQVDALLPNKEGEYVCNMRDFGSYVLKKWYMGRECDIRREREIIEACKVLAILHNYLDVVSEQITSMEADLSPDERWSEFVGTNLIEEWKRHNQGLKKAREFMRNRVGKGAFESIYIKNFNEIYAIASRVELKMKFSQYKDLYQRAIRERQLVHGDYNYHNVLFVGSGTAVTNFERFRIDVSIADFYYFLRKVMEKCNWNESLGRKMIESYQRERMITEAEYEYIALRLSYPEKVWKLTNYYYNTNKAWISENNVEKLKISIEQLPIKQQFVQSIFSFHL